MIVIIISLWFLKALRNPDHTLAGVVVETGNQGGCLLD
jgi:hypothetical protein